MRLHLLVDGVFAEEIDDREMALSLLRRLDGELIKRGEAYREAGVSDASSYRNSGYGAMPRLLLSVEALDDLFAEDDRTSQEASMLLDRLVRQGPPFDLYVNLIRPH